VGCCWLPVYSAVLPFWNLISHHLFFFSFLIYQRLALRAVFFFSDIVGVWWMMVVLMVGEERVCWFLLSASLFL
jgi:hypothetical protein